MTRTPPPTRQSNSSQAAAAVLLMVLATGLVTVASQPAAIRGGETRTAIRESEAVRSVVAAVRAVAEDLLGGQRTTAALWTSPCLLSNLGETGARRALPVSHGAPALRVLSERLLDLPPPVC